MIGVPNQSSPSPDTAPSWQRRREPTALARNGMVASGHPLVSAAGLRALAAGGNAVDAAVAAALTAAVVQPAQCGLGGDLFAIVHAPSAAASGDSLLAFHGSGIAPRITSIEHMQEHGEAGGTLMPQVGPLSVSVPGFVDGVFTLLDRFGSRPFPELAASALQYAGEGFPLTPNGVRRITSAEPLLRKYPTSAAVWLPGGQIPAVGAIVRQSDLARTLHQIAVNGRNAFYSGDVPRRIGAFMAANGGVLTADDFTGHVTAVSSPIATTYRDYTIYETGLPTQGFLVLEALNIAEQDDLATIGVDSADGVHLLAEAMKLAFADRLAYAGEPACVDPPLSTLISKPWAACRRQQIDPERAADDVAAGSLSDGDTTYLCAVDGDGMMVSLIISLSGGFGSGVIAGDTGIMLNNRAGNCFSLVPGHPNIFAPGKKTMHTLNCYLIADRDGVPVLVGGTPGGDGQPQWNLQVITGLIDAGLDVQAATELPRWTVWPGTYPAQIGHPFELQVEDRLGEPAIADLAARGHRIVSAGDWGVGSVQLIARDPDTGVLVGGSDPRAEGVALGY